MLREIARAARTLPGTTRSGSSSSPARGRAFCVGADLKAWSRDYLGKPDEYWKWFGAFKDAHDRLREIGKPTVARINGVCVGGGNELQMACDLSVIADDTYIRHVGPQHGSVPAGGATQWLPIMVGTIGPARSSPPRGAPGPQGGGVGLVNRAVPAADLDATVDELVELTAKLPQTVRATRSSN